MPSTDPKLRLTPRVVTAYGLLALSTCTVIGAAVWLMPRLPNEFTRELAGFGLLVLLAFALAAVVGRLLSDDEAQQIMPKRRKR